MKQESLEKNRLILEDKIQKKYKEQKEDFFESLNTTSQTFWRKFKEQKLPTQQIFKTKELLELTKEEMLSIFFGETKISEKVLVFYNFLLKNLATLTNEEKSEFLKILSQRIDSLRQ